MAQILVTGAAGFIGAHAAAALAQAGHRVVGCDSFNAYYPVELKHARVAALLQPAGVPVERLDLCDGAALQALMRQHRIDTVLHLAAQAGVRHSVSAPLDYVQANLLGFASVLEACRLQGVDHLLYASSSSVYGRRDGDAAPGGFRESDRIDAPASFYAATKQANEAMAHATAAVHRLPVTGLRFFTVYGPWGRPDMAYWGFAERLRRGETLQLYGQGELRRDFTHVDDVVDALLRLVARGAPAGRQREDGVPAELFNIGHRHPVRVIDFVRLLERATGCPARIEFAPMQAGDVPDTSADPSRLIEAIGPWRATPLAEGLAGFVRWLEGWNARGASPRLALAAAA
ncbi:NAD-dependent epimerase/dehydratase family protein [Sphaerotilus natans]|uniref:NAD-dependent epimerase/dehydratase family protein n=1 Tax=Sphaerotilus natans TaxID=34103 RepID=UPI00406CFD94